MNFPQVISGVRLSSEDLEEIYGCREKIQAGTIDEQTIMFWNLQLQFMERSFESLKDVYKGLRYGSMYVQNLHTGKMDRLLHQYVCSEEDRLCLATHLAVQLSGIEE